MKTTLKDIYDVQIATKLEIEELETHDDSINVNISASIIYLAKLLPGLSLQAFGKKKVSKEAVISTCARVLRHMMILSNECNFDMPEEDELDNFEVVIPDEVRQDAVLTITNMICSLTDLLHLINVDTEEPIWSVEELPQDFEDDMFSIIIGIRHLGVKFGFGLDDIIAKVVD